MRYKIFFIPFILISINLFSQPQFTELSRFGNSYNSHCMAIADFNGDNNLDVAVGNVWDGQNQLYINRGNLNFDLLNLFGYFSTRGLAWGDYNNDGMLDLAVANDWDEENILYIQIYPSVFALLDIFGLSNSYAISWADYDNDGDLDAAVINGVQGSEQNYLYKNMGNANFEELPRFGYGRSRSGIWGDYDNDGKPDFAVGQREAGLSIYHNEGNGIFTEISISTPSCVCGLAWGDYDTDGDLDLAVATLLTSSVDILKNNHGSFEVIHVGDLYNCSAIEWLDFDLDGDLDLAVGSYSDTIPLVIYENQVDTIFTRYNLSEALCILSLAVGDMDNDGDIDICVPVYYNNLQNKLFRNDINASNYVKVRVRGKAIQGYSNFCGIGANVRIFDAESGELRGFREISSGGLGGSMSAMEAIFGVSLSGTYTVVVEWPASGIVDSVKNVTAPKVLTIYEGQGTGIEQELPSKKLNILSIYPNPGKEQFYVYYTIEKPENVSLKVYDISGKLIKNFDRGFQNPAVYSFIWSGKDNNNVRLKTGVYFVILERGNELISKKVLILK